MSGSYELLLETILTPVVIASQDMIIAKANPEAHRMFGYQGGELVGRSVKVLMTRDTQEKHDAYVRNYVEGGEPRIIGVTSRQVVGVTKTGERLDLLLSIAENKESGIFIASFQDITQVLKQKQALQDIARRKDVEALNFLAHQLKGRFISMESLLERLEAFMSHKSEIHLQESMQILRDLKAETGRGYQICMLDQVARQIMHEVYQPEQSVIELRRMLDEVCCRQYVYELSASMPEFIVSDSYILFHVLDSFICNATKYGGSRFEPKVFVSNESSEYVVFTVINAPGRSHDQLRSLNVVSLFERGTRAHPSEQGSRGNGLFFAKKCAEAVQGEVGLIFYDDRVEAILRIPLIEARRDTEVIDAEPRLGSSLVLAALDDDKICRAIYKQLFKKLGVCERSLEMIRGETKAEIEDFDEWVMTLQSNDTAPHLVLLDENLDEPGSSRGFMKGSDIAKTLKARGYRGKIVICSANDDAINVAHYLEMGADSFISKSVRDVPTFAAKIAAVLQ